MVRTVTLDFVALRGEPWPCPRPVPPSSHPLCSDHTCGPGAECTVRLQGCPTFGISGPHWKKKSCLGTHIKYIATRDHKEISSCFR